MFQYFIYDEDTYSCYNEESLIYDYSLLYTNEEDCRQAAIDTCRELAEEYDDEDRFKYRVIEQQIVK